MSENSAVDAAALRREARRKRILENSESRLRSITGGAWPSPHEGKPKADNCFQNHHDEIRNEQSNDVFEGFNRETGGDEINSKEHTPRVNSDEHTKIQTNDQSTYFDSLIQKRMHYVFLSVIVSFLYFLKLGYLFYYNLFCPFLTVKLMEFLTTSQQTPMQNISIISLMAYKSTHPVISHICKAYLLITMTISDFLLYTFSFVLSNKLFSALTDII